uniref:Uncharacterized protein n=1 Tax=Anopheles culicifacies TaxID=139723 RepID=A0A182MGA8_9DIPT
MAASSSKDMARRRNSSLLLTGLTLMKLTGPGGYSSFSSNCCCSFLPSSRSYASIAFASNDTSALLAVVSHAAVVPLQPQQLELLKPNHRATLDEALAQLLENIRELLRTGDPERGIPVMAPLQTDQLDVDLSLGGLLDFTAILRNLFVDGLDRFQGTLTLNVMQMEFRYDFLFPDVVARGHYDANGRLFGLIPVFGIGNFNVAPRDLRIQGTALLRQLPSGYLHMPELKATVRLGSLQVVKNNIEGMLLGGELSDLLNVVIQDLVPSVLVNFAPEVTEIISRVGIPIADSILNTMTLDDLFALIPLTKANDP